MTAAMGLRGFRLNLAVESASSFEDLAALAPRSKRRWRREVRAFAQGPVWLSDGVARRHRLNALPMKKANPMGWFFFAFGDVRVAQRTFSSSTSNFSVAFGG